MRKYKITFRVDDSEYALICSNFEKEKNSEHKYDWYKYTISDYIREILINNCLSKKSDKKSRMSDVNQEG